jgi:hypothetical protein
MDAPENPEWTTLQRWVIGVGTVVAVVAAVIAFTAGGTPNRAMQAPFDPPAPTRATPAICVTPTP